MDWMESKLLQMDLEAIMNLENLTLVWVLFNPQPIAMVVFTYTQTCRVVMERAYTLMGVLW